MGGRSTRGNELSSRNTARRLVFCSSGGYISLKSWIAEQVAKMAEMLLRS